MTTPRSQRYFLEAWIFSLFYIIRYEAGRPGEFLSIEVTIHPATPRKRAMRAETLPVLFTVLSVALGTKQQVLKTHLMNGGRELRVKASGSQGRA